MNSSQCGALDKRGDAVGKVEGALITGRDVLNEYEISPMKKNGNNALESNVLSSCIVGLAAVCRLHAVCVEPLC